MHQGEQVDAGFHAKAEANSGQVGQDNPRGKKIYLKKTYVETTL